MREPVRRLIFPSAFAELRAIAASMSLYPNLRRAVADALHRGPSGARDTADAFRLEATAGEADRNRALVLVELARLLDEWANDELDPDAETPELEDFEAWARERGLRLCEWQVEALEAIFTSANEPLEADAA